MIKKDVVIHFQYADDLPEDNWCAFITEGEFSPVIVSAYSIGEAIIEVGKSIHVLELHNNQKQQ